MAKREQEPKTLRDGNGRVARLARWLATQPAAAAIDTLVLEHRDEGEWKKLQVWPRSEATPLIANQIDATVSELANELAAYVTARVVWFDSAAATYWTEHALRVQPEDLGVEQVFSGETQNVAIQVQRHQERLHNLNASMISTSMSSLQQTNVHLSDTNTILAGENNRLRQELYDVRTRLLEAEAEVSRAMAAADEALGHAERNAQRSANDNQDRETMAMVLSLLQQQGMPAARRAS